MVFDKTKKRILFPAAVLLVFAWLCIILVEKNGYEEQVVGEETFTAAFDTISQLSFSNQVYERKELLDREPADIRVTFLDENGESAGTMAASGVDLHTEGFTYADATGFEGAGLSLVPGRSYRLEVQAECGGEVFTDGILVSLIHGRISFLWLMPVLILAAGGILAVLFFGEERSLLFPGAVLLLAVFLFTMPMLLGLDPIERQAFGAVYDRASALMGLPRTGETVSVWEPQLKNLDYLTYSVPLFRFWTGDHLVRGVAQPAVCISGGEAFTSLQLPALLGVLIARNLRLSYRMVLLAGWMAGAGTTFLLSAFGLSLLSEEKGMRQFLLQVVLLPSFVTASMSFTGYGVYLGLLVLFAGLAVGLKSHFSSVRACFLFLYLALLILFRTESVLLGFALLAALEEHYDTKQTRILAYGAWSVLTVLLLAAAIRTSSGFPGMYRELVTAADRLSGELVCWRGYDFRKSAVSGSLLLFLLADASWHLLKGKESGWKTAAYSLLMLGGAVPFLCAGERQLFGAELLPAFLGIVLAGALSGASRAEEGSGRERKTAAAALGLSLAAGLSRLMLL